MAASAEIERLIQLLAKLPGLGPRSARRAALHLLKRRETLLDPLAHSLRDVSQTIVTCPTCGNLDTVEPCAICRDERRDETLLCVVEDVADLWAIERTKSFRGRYHILGGVLSALDGVTPEDLNIATLTKRVRDEPIAEVILATNATVDGQTTAHYINDLLADAGITLTYLAHGVPIGGELDYLDDGTLATALRARRAAP